MNKLISNDKILDLVKLLKCHNKKIVFTNGCFDIVHLGHIKLLQKCKEFGTVIVGINGDVSVKRLKGKTRPINEIAYRVEFLSHLDYVDYIIVFDEDTPINLIEQISPDYLIKGNDYEPIEIVGYDYVTSYGGKVLTFGFNINQSTTQIVSKTHIYDKICENITMRINNFKKLLNNGEFKDEILNSISILKNVFDNGGKLFIAGNGGSAEQANHFVSELMGHYLKTDKYLPAISLCDNVSLLTSLANDYSYAEVFKKSFSPLASKNDCLFLITTSGNSENILVALKQAKHIGIKTIMLTSTTVSKEACGLSDCVIKVPDEQSHTIQEAHLFVIHYLSEVLKSE